MLKLYFIATWDITKNETADEKITKLVLICFPINLHPSNFQMLLFLVAKSKGKILKSMLITLKTLLHSIQSTA